MILICLFWRTSSPYLEEIGYIYKQFIWKSYNSNNNLFSNDYNITKGFYGGGSSGDYDNDGDIDLVFAGYNKNSAVETFFLMNNGSDLPKAQDYGLNQDYFQGSIAFFDYDNDGDLDLAMSGGDGDDNLIVYKSNVARLINNSAPSAPTVMNSVYGDGLLNLSWNNGTDDLTPSTGLYYNIRVGTTPYGNDVVSGKYGGSSNPTQGYLGNMMSLREYSLNVSEERTYYWQVQAIDNGLKPGNWSLLQTYDPCEYNTGDWNININCSRYNEIINVSGNVNINGDFTLVNANITSTDLWINGTLNLTNSNITADNIIINGTVVLNNSELYGNVSLYDNASDLVINGELSLNESNMIIYNSSATTLSNNGNNNSLVNVSYNSDSIISGNYFRKWYVTFYPINSSTNLSSVTVNAYNSSGDLIVSSSVDNSSKVELIEYYNDGTKSYYTNYTTNASKQYYTTNSSIINFTDNYNYVILLERSTEPIINYTNFNLSTDFSNVSDLDNVENAFIGISDKGLINFTENISVNGEDIDNAISISDNNITVNAFSGINKSANITFFGLNYSAQPLALRNGVYCTSCSVNYYSNGEFSFNVSGFSSYSTTENSQISLSLNSTYYPKFIPNDDIIFTLNYSDVLTNGSIVGDCRINFSIGSAVSMSYSGNYSNISQFASVGLKNYTIVCDGNSSYEDFTISGTLDVKSNVSLIEENESFNLTGYRVPSLVLKNESLFIFGNLEGGGGLSKSLYQYANNWNLINSSGLIGTTFGSIVLVDYDKDGDLDLVQIGKPQEGSNGTMKIYNKN
ncbi:VCBS repeat-containing protein [Candidatus Woesearchaeota archaeon]|nr:VCBS repeat-containing protein [Candidatus Woesearchaeota archaeon]